MCPQTVADDGALILATATEAVAPEVLDDLALTYDREVRHVSVTDGDLEILIERLVVSAERGVEVTRTGTDDDLVSDVRDLASQPPVIRFVNMLLRDAFDAGASDIHVEATRDGLAVRYRLDGVLAPAPEPSFDLRHAVVSRIKLLADLDIAERRRPQDGRIRVRLENRDLDVRVSTVPTMHGESVVMRLLERGGRPIELAALGLGAALLPHVESVVARPHGMLLVTGPTGSGKTTTLYAALNRRAASREKIITVEEPIEYQLAGIAQVPVHRDAGVTFATALRSILRQDPDVVMIGEMRDAETTEIAVQAALTGHLVLSTLHTNDALSAIPRLQDLGAPEFLIAATIEGVLAQRLVRKICDVCAVTEDVDDASLAELAGRPMRRMPVRRGIGCRACRGTGYSGRTGIFEFLRMTDAMRDAITRRASRTELREVALADGFVPMQADAWTRVQQGLTTVEEALRVVRH
ncbi:MAG: type II/IV secretion system protein [Gemmatimonadaceae bacterium]|nr:type II/IV secretion system protein [Gemmatimonadaceae bacterium]